MAFSLKGYSEDRLYDHLQAVWGRALEKYGKTGDTNYAFQDGDKKVNLIGARGFSAVTMEPVEKNTNTAWDDAMIVIWKDGGVKHVKVFQLSTEQNTDGGIACLLPEMHLYWIHFHKVNNTWEDISTLSAWKKGLKYRALKCHPDGVQCIYEDKDDSKNYKQDNGEKLYRDKAINIHYGGEKDSPAGWSLGCQVLKGWANFKDFLKLVEADTSIKGTIDNELAPKPAADGSRYLVYTLLEAADLAPESASGVYFPVDLGSGALASDAGVAAYYDHTEKTIKAGYFPLGTNTVWHGGVHVHADAGSPVVAMMDGVLVAARLPEEDAIGDERYGSRSFILLRHEIKGSQLMEAGPRKLLALKVIKDGYGVRTSPGKGTNSLGTLKAGDELTPKSQTPLMKDGLAWYECTIKTSAVTGMAGKDCWAALVGDYVKEDREPPPPGINADEIYVFYSLYMHLGREKLDITNTRIASIPWLKSKIRMETPPSSSPAPTAPPAQEQLKIIKAVSLKSVADSSVIGWFDAGVVVNKLGTQSGMNKVGWQSGTPGIGFYKDKPAVTEGLVTTSSIYVRSATADEKAAAGNPAAPPAKPVLDQRFVSDLKTGSVLKFDIPVKAGEQLWTVGQYGSPGYRCGLIHWEIFSQKNLFPQWKKAEDTDDNFNMDCADILKLVDQDYFGSDEVLTADEIQRFYSSGAATGLRKTVCRFKLEWGIDVDKAVNELKGDWLTELSLFAKGANTLADKIKPYCWWNDASSASVPLPPSPLTYHYNPVAFVDAMRAIARPVVPAAGTPPAPPPAPTGGDGDYNAEVLATVNSMSGGGYKWEKGNPDCGPGVPEDIVFKSTTLLKAVPEYGTYCCGYTFWVFFKVAMAHNMLDSKTVKQVREAQQAWYIGLAAAGLKGPAYVLPTLAIGDAIDPEEARPGDFLQIWRTNGSGHSVVFTGWETAADGTKIGVKYRSTQPSTDGIGDRMEKLSGHGGSVDYNKLYFGRLTGPA